MTQINMGIKVAFYVWTKNSYYTDNIKCQTNVALKYKNEFLDYRDKLFN